MICVFVDQKNMEEKMNKVTSIIKKSMLVSLSSFFFSWMFCKCRK